MNYFLNGEIEDETVEEFITVVNQLQFEDHLHVWVNCVGGAMPHADLIEAILNKRKDQVSLHVVGDCSSSAFDILYRFKGYREIREYAVCVLHISDSNVSSRGLKSKSSVSTKVLKHYDKIDEESIKEWSRFLNKKEIRSLKKGEEVILEATRLRDIIENQDRERYVEEVKSVRL